MTKINSKMIALCTAAIGSIYFSGYAMTEPAKATVDINPTTSIVSTAPVHHNRKQEPKSNNFSNDNPNSDSISKQTTYKDGTYYGMGQNRIGAVEVAVTIKRSKITDVKITNCTTSYSQSYIDGLPQQVIDRQGENVDIVSGATRSTEDFKEAVNQALQQAALPVPHD